jgi:hypothetical protein
MRKLSFVLLLHLTLLGFLCSGIAQGHPVSGEKRTPIFLELFTSEGCSSCPPADAFVESLDASQPIPRAHLIVLSEHVDYFNHDGWTDPYSSSAITSRQYAYAHSFKLKDAYTPQIIVDGDEILPTDNSQAMREIFDRAAVAPMIPLRLGKLLPDAKGNQPKTLHIDIDRNTSPKNAGVFVAIALDHAASKVLAGENEGKSLTHVAVLQSLTKVGELKPDSSFNKDVALKLRASKPARKLRVIVFLQESGPGKVLGAAEETTEQ